MRTIAICFVLLLSACSAAVQDIYSVPPEPTYDKDVRYFLADHCVLCHGSPPNRGAPATFRLDVYDVPNSTEPGAFAMASSILADITSGRMPPGGGIGPNAKKMIALWVDHGAPR
jgi:hypothetical protein